MRIECNWQEDLSEREGSSELSEFTDKVRNSELLSVYVVIIDSWPLWSDVSPSSSGCHRQCAVKQAAAAAS